jgi:hypothetical protein
MKTLNEKADLPNRDGFKFVAVTKDGKHVVCKVIKRHSDGCHRVRGVKYSEIVGWLPYKPPQPVISLNTGKLS